MTTHPGLAYRDADVSHAIIQVFANGDIRDRLLVQNIDLNDIRAVDVDFKQLTPPELDAMGVLAIPEQVEFNDVVSDYVAERLARLCDQVKLNVNAAIASGTPHLVDTMVWSTPLQHCRSPLRCRHRWHWEAELHCFSSGPAFYRAVAGSCLRYHDPPASRRIAFDPARHSASSLYRRLRHVTRAPI